jgi:hypothetical protein
MMAVGGYPQNGGTPRLSWASYATKDNAATPLGLNSSAVLDSTKFVIGVDFARLKGSGDGLTGVDLSTVPLELELERTSEFEDIVIGMDGGNQTDAKCLLWLFVEHDAYFKISANQMNVLN